MKKLKSDIEKARQGGYSMLLFFHEPIATKNPTHADFASDDAMLVGDPGGFPKNFYLGTTRGTKMAGNDECDEPTKKVYAIITENADVVKGVFAGHSHSDMHIDINAKNPDGSEALITQYVNTALAYDNGHLMRIIIK